LHKQIPHFLWQEYTIPYVARVLWRFFKTFRTVSEQTESTYSKTTISFANNFSVQRLRPSGGSEQLNATKCASCSPSKRGALKHLLGSRSRAFSNPFSTSRCLIRSIVRIPTSRD